MVATVQDGRVTRLRPDREHPLSRGYACPKGVAMLDVQNDPDRVVTPLRRVGGPGDFEPVSWDTALADIASRLGAVRDAHGGGAVGWYAGNPSAFSHSHPIWVKGFMEALGSQHFYTASSQDVANRFVASELLYGSPGLLPIPDLRRTRFLLVVGANPLVSHGSVLTAPRIREQLRDVVDRGGRVVVVDPRRSETARAFEHLPVRPDSDALLLLSLLQVVFAEGLADEAAIDDQTTGSGWLRGAVAPFTPESTAARTGVPAGVARQLARDFAAADGAAAYGRTGSCLGRFGTLTAFLLDALTAVTGNFDAPGGLVVGKPAIAADELLAGVGLDTYGTRRSRIGGFPEVLGAMPASLLADEVQTEGEGRLRALFVSAGNPVLSVPDGAALERALADLDLMVSLDLYVNETNRHADYVLPATTFLEREDLPVAFLGLCTTPFVQWTDPVVEPRGEARDEWTVVRDLADAIGVNPLPGPARRLPRWLARRVTPERLIDAILRRGPEGDLFGLRPRGLSVRALRREPHGRVVAEHVATGVQRDRLHHPDGRVHLDPAPIRGELDRLLALGEAAGDDFPLRMVNLRELRSHNSWMHNSPLLVRGGRRHAARINPDDAAAAGVVDGGPVRLVSPWGAVETEAMVTGEMSPGAVAVPHGWGHKGGWRVANGLGGPNVNQLASRAPEHLEPLSGMAWLTGVPVRVEPVVAPAVAEREAEVAAPA